jgi:hypothetical protein
MGCCVCCFGSCLPKSCAISGIIITAIAFGFLIWGVADMVWPYNSGAKPTYIIAFVAVILILLGFIGLLIILFARNPTDAQTLNKTGKIISIVILVLGGIAIICLIIAEIILIVKYADAENILDEYSYLIDVDLPGRWWACATVPGIMSIILIPIALKAANALVQIFSKGIDIPLNDLKESPPIGPGQGQIVINTTNVSITQDQTKMNLGMNQKNLGLDPNNIVIPGNPQNIKFGNIQPNNGQI